MNSENEVTHPDNADINPALTQSFQMLLDDKELMFQMLDMFPIPVEIFSADGFAVFSNKAFANFNGIADADSLIGKYNVLTDPVINDHMGLRDFVQRAFRGEAVSRPFRPPIQDLVDRGLIDEKPFESANAVAHLFPVWEGEQIVYVVFVLVVKSIYQGHPDVARAKEYIDTHCQEEFDKDVIAKALNISVSQLYSLFKQYAGITPKEYYQTCKVERIKEKLADENLTITEAFAVCGADSQGWLAKVFKEMTGMCPKEYRASLSSIDR